MAAKLPDWFKGGGDGGARGGCVGVVVDSVCGGREVSSNVNVDVDDDRICGRRYGDKGLGVSCCGEGYRTGSEAAAVADRIAQDFVMRRRWMGFSFQVFFAVV